MFLIHFPLLSSCYLSAMGNLFGNVKKPSSRVQMEYSVTVSKTSADGSSETETRTLTRKETSIGGSRTMPPVSLHAGFGGFFAGISAGGSSKLAIKQ